VHKDASLFKTRNPHLLRQLPCRRAGAARAEQRAFEQLSLGREAGKLPGPSSHHAPVREHASLTCVLHQSRPRYTMLDWHPSAQIKLARLEPRVTASALEMWNWSLLSRLERKWHELFNPQSVCTRRMVPSAGAGATRCAVLGPDQLSTTTKRVVALK
jgi:hypothetical protein